MSVYNFQAIEKKWQAYWEENHLYYAKDDPSLPKYYVLDMFPYPSGAGLHVGHPLGYIASDVMARYKKLQGYNVLHPMGFDSFGLPAEQYAIQTGQHPALTTEQNINRYKEQLKNIGFAYDWSRELRTSDPQFYRWTQWIFIQLFHSWYNNKTQRAEGIDTLIEKLATSGTDAVDGVCDEQTPTLTAEQWQQFSEKEQQAYLFHFRLAYLEHMTVNWCPDLGTVLANDEVKEGVSERGGYLVEQKEMLQWALRITAYAPRLLNDLDTLDWSDSLKEMQRNWIGKSVGAELDFTIEAHDFNLRVFTTRIDTIFGVTFMAIAPESDLIKKLTTPEQQAAVKAYIAKSKTRSERDRMSDVKTVSGVFSGSYALHPLSGTKIPIWIADYVLSGYGTGAVMGVPSSDERDLRFATHFDLPVVRVIEGTETLEDPTTIKRGKMIHSDFLNGLSTEEAIEKALQIVEEKGIGQRKVNYKLRDTIFARQRYWGEPIPVYYKDNTPYTLPESALPLTLPDVDKYLPTSAGEPPLGRATQWQTVEGYPLELNTMPGWAGSSWYFLRYMDAQNEEIFAEKKFTDYWQQVDLYIGGTEHAVGHLLYARFWTKFLFDRGFIGFEEPFKKLINQGMIQGMSHLAYRVKDTNMFVSANLKDQYDTTELHVDIGLVNNEVLDMEAFRSWRPDLKEATFILEEEKYVTISQVEKMSKRYYNVVNPDDVVGKYGADTLRLYEMFLGPLEQSKPWNTQGIDGVSRFLKKLWRLFYDGQGKLIVQDEAPTEEELKLLHTAIKGVTEDLERYAFNTPVSKFMVCVNGLTDTKCYKRLVLKELLILLSPYAPHIAEELWQNALGVTTSIAEATFPVFDEKHLKEEAFEYPISVNGKVRAKISFGLDVPKEEMEKEVLAHEAIQKWLEGKSPKKVIIVPKRIVNVVV